MLWLKKDSRDVMVHGVQKWTQGLQCQQMCSDQPPSVEIKAEYQHEDMTGGTFSTSLISSEPLAQEIIISSSDSKSKGYILMHFQLKINSPEQIYLSIKAQHLAVLCLQTDSQC